MKINVLIVDDEFGCRETLFKMLNKYCPNVRIAGQADGVEQALELIKSQQPDIVLLDIKMNDGTAFDLLKNIEKIDFKIIFVTAYDEFAIDAIKFSALDYLLKPVESTDLIVAIKKAEQLLEQEVMNMKVRTLLHNVEKENKKLTVKTSDSFHVIPINEIIRCEAESNYTKFYLQDESKIMVSTTLKEYEDILSQYKFYRIHQSHLVNLDQILRFDKKNGTIVMRDKSELPVSLKKKERLFELLENL